MQDGKLNIIMDAQWGSGGKAKLATWLAHKHGPAVSVVNFGPNAGHTTVLDDGRKVMLRFLPSACVDTDVHACLGPDCVIDVESLLAEIQTINCTNRLTIHPHACVLRKDHAERAKSSGERIAGTQKGTGWALSEKSLRTNDASVAMNCPTLKPWIGDTRAVTLEALMAGRSVLVEMAQGWDLSLNWGHEWPYVTSRDVTVGTALNNCGLGPRWLGDVYGIVRPYPIRVGNIYREHGNAGLFGDMDKRELLGWSGPCWPDQEELSWEEVTRRSGSPTPLCEKTTVTGRVRRVFTFSDMQVAAFCRANNPTRLFLNFAQYLDWTQAGATVATGYKSPAVVEFARRLNKIAHENHGGPVTILGTGAKQSEMVEISPLCH